MTAGGTRRVVVRHLIEPAPPPGQPTLTDVVGDLIGESDDVLTVDSRRGVVEIPRRLVVATRVIPPTPRRRGAPHRALSIADLQLVMVDSWPPLERAMLGQWVLRAGRGFSGRANSVIPIGDPGRPVAAAIDQVERWYAARGLPAKLTLAGPVGFEPARDPLGADLLLRGYTFSAATLTLTAATRTVTASPPAADVADLVTRSPVLDDRWLAALARYRPIDEVAARSILTGSAAQVFARIERDDTIVAIGRLAVDHGWGGIGAMWVDPAYRREGLAATVLRVLAQAAAERGVVSLHLQTDVGNTAALALYRARGFTPHHGYVYATQS